MRLAFLENNDISLDTWKDIDFNSLSTATILKRNIQQQIQQQIKEQRLRAKQLYQKQQQLYQKQEQLFQKQEQLLRNHQLYRTTTTNNNNNTHHHASIDDIDHSQQVLIFNGDDDGLVVGDCGDEMVDDDVGGLVDDEVDDDVDDDGMVDDDEDEEQDVECHMGQAQLIEDDYLNGINNNCPLSDSKIFATAMPITSDERNQATTSSTPIRTSRATTVASRRHLAQAVKNDVKPSGLVLSASKKDSPSKLSAKCVNKSPATPTAGDLSLGEFRCSEPNCGKSFPSSRKLRHHKVVHSDEHPFQCQFKGCEKKFKRKFGIDLHSTTHFDLDPEMYAKTSNNSSLPFFGRRMQYSMCKPCGERFKTVHEYQNHMLNHGKEPFKCPVKDCGQTFSIWKSFQKHRASHYFNYYCKMDPRCEHSTSNLQLLKLHIYCCHFQRRLPTNATLSSTK